MLEDYLWWVAGKKVIGPVFVCMYVCLSVFPSTFSSGARAAGPIGPGEYSFDAPEWRTDDGFRPISYTGHMPRAIAQTLAESCSHGCRPNQNDGFGPTLVG